MGFVSTMKKIGQVGLKALPIVAQIFAPGTAGLISALVSGVTGGAVSPAQVSAATGTFVGVLEQIVGIIGTVEHLFTSAFTGQQTGPQKLLAALPDVKTLLMESQLLAGHQVVDAQGFTDGATLIINGVVKVLNSVAPKGSAPAPAAPLLPGPTAGA